MQLLHFFRDDVNINIAEGVISKSRTHDGRPRSIRFGPFEHKLKPGHPTIILARRATIAYKVSHPRLIPSRNPFGRKNKNTLTF